MSSLTLTQMNEIKKNIQKSIQAYLFDKSVHYAFLITGKWGSGKTYFVTQLMDSWNTGVEGDDNSIQLKPINVSLNGIATISGLYHAIWKQIYPILNSRGAKVDAEQGQSYIIKVETSSEASEPTFSVIDSVTGDVVPIIEVKPLSK